MRVSHDRRKREAYPEPGKQRWCRHGSRVRGRCPSGLLLGVLLRNRMAQQRSHFFLDVEDEVCLAQIFGPARILTFQLLIFFFSWIALGLRTTLLWSQRLANAV